MLSNQRVALLGAVGILLGLALLGVFAVPEVVAFGPESSAPHVPASAPVRIEFDRAMDRVSVESRLTVTPTVPGQIEWENNTLLFHPLGSWPTGQEISVRLAPGARTTRFLPMLSSLQWTFQVGEPRLAYLWPSTGKSDLYVLDLSTQKRSRLTDTEAGVIDYSVGPRGTSVVYTAARGEGSSDIRLIDLITGTDSLLHECGAASRCQSPVISPDGELVAFERFDWETSAAGSRVPGLRQVWLMPNISGASPVRVTPEEQATNSPNWSPDGVLTLYNDSLRAITFIEPEGLEPVNLVPNGLGLLGSWSPSGDYLILPEIVFPAEAEQGEPDFYSHLYRINTATLDIEDLSFGSVEDASPAYSPDGEWIAFGRKYLDERWTPGRQVWIMRADGSQPRAVTDEPDFSHSSLAWSPDSTHFVYMRLNLADPNQVPEIWMTSWEGVEYQFLVEGGYLPQWIP